MEKYQSMVETRWFRHSLRIGVVEYQRTVRKFWMSKGRLIILCGPVVFISLALFGLSLIFVDELRSLSGSISLPASTRGTIGMFWLFYTFLIGQKVITERSHIACEELLLTTVSARTVASGLVVAEILRITSLVALPTVIVTGMVVYAFYTPVSILLLPIAVGLFVLSSIIVGYAGGFIGALLLVRSRFVARYKTVIGTVLAIVFFGGYSALLYAPVLDLDIGMEVLAWIPVSWFVDLAVVGAPITQSWVNVAGVLITTLVILIGGGYAIVWLTTALWFDDPVRVDDGETTPPTPGPSRDALTSALRPLRLPSGLDTPVRRVAQTTLIRTWRNPSKLSFVMLPVFMAGGSLINVVRLGLASEIAPVIAVIAIPWIAGAAFGLNPLGDERRVLPTTLTTSLTGKQFVHGITIPGRLIGLPAVIVLTVGTTVVSPYSILERVGLLAIGVVLLFTSVQLAPLVGMWFPRFSAVTVRQSREVVPPSITAMSIHSLVTVGLGSIAVASLLIPDGVQIGLRLLIGGAMSFLFELVADAGFSIAATPAQWIAGVQAKWIRVCGFGFPLVIAVAVADRAQRYASTIFDTYTVE
jgi:ABC-2 type transport system permease protein